MGEHALTPGSTVENVWCPLPDVKWRPGPQLAGRNSRQISLARSVSSASRQVTGGRQTTGGRQLTEGRQVTGDRTSHSAGTHSEETLATLGRQETIEVMNLQGKLQHDTILAQAAEESA